MSAVDNDRDLLSRAADAMTAEADRLDDLARAATSGPWGQKANARGRKANAIRAAKFASDIALTFREQAEALRAEAELPESQQSPGALRTARAFLLAREAMGR